MKWYIITEHETNDGTKARMTFRQVADSMVEALDKVKDECQVLGLPGEVPIEAGRLDPLVRPMTQEEELEALRKIVRAADSYMGPNFAPVGALASVSQDPHQIEALKRAGLIS